MSSIIFVSNQVSERRQNQTNDFEIDVNPPIDARSGDKKIVLEEIIYPNTLSSIHPRNKELFKFKFVITFGNFVYDDSSDVFKNATLKFYHDWIHIPYGHHSLDDLIMFINKTMDLIGCKIERVMGKKCVITFSKMFEVYSVGKQSFDGYKSDVKLPKNKNRHFDKGQYNVKIDITFSKGLVHVLGFVEDVVTFEFKKSNLKSSELMEYAGQYVMDPSFGLNFMCVICDQIVPVKMGYEFKERLAVCPIKLFNPENKNNDLSISYVPKNCVRELRPEVIRSMHFQIKDMNYEKLYFNSGKVVLICDII